MSPFDLLCKFLVLIGIMEPVTSYEEEDYMEESPADRKYRFKNFVNREKHIQSKVTINASSDFDDDQWGDC